MADQVLPDQPARDRIRHALDETLVVEAAAGTGKTTELVRRIVAVLAGGHTTIDRIVAVTFTEKAAGELKLRLRQGLEDARGPAANLIEKSHLEEALARLEEARISTIHGFCADLLRERPVEAGVDPNFQPLAEPEARRLYDEAFDDWLLERLDDPTEGIRRSLRRPSERPDGPIARLRHAGWTLVEWRDYPAPWRRPEFYRERDIDALVTALHAFADLTREADNPNNILWRATEPARLLGDRIRNSEEVRPRDYDGLEADLVEIQRKGEFKKLRKPPRGLYRDGLPMSAVAEMHRELLNKLAAFASDADADLAALLRDELQESLARYEALKARHGRLDFVDLLVRARNLIRDSDDVRAEAQRRFERIFVDEFQDTDPLQAEILLLLAAADPSIRDWRRATPVPGKLFIVGDPKQSIYRFRRADIAVYQDVRARLGAAGATAVELTTSFRAVAPIQAAVNAAFAPEMILDPTRLQAGYVPLAPDRGAPGSQPAIVALPVPSPYGAGGYATKTAIEASLPDAVGAFVHWLIAESGWTVDEDRARVPMAPRHVCLLFRRFESWGHDVTFPYVAALEARGVPHLLVGGRSFHRREEVEAIRAALEAVEWPDAELSVFATLRGPLFAIPDEVLLEYRSARSRLHPFAVRGDVPAGLEAVGESLRLLASLHRRRNQRPIAETIGRLLDATRAHAGFVLRPGGEQALANVLHVAELARQYEAAGGISFRGFVERLLADAETGDAPEAPTLEQGSDGVRLMTVHKAKGLEFPVVILVDMTANRRPSRAGRYVDGDRGLCAVRLAGWSPADLNDFDGLEVEREEAEGLRVAYVAATRARDLLVVPAVGDQPFEGGWLSSLNRAIYPEKRARRSSRPAPGCPAFGESSVRGAAGEPDRPHISPVRPGLHHFEGPEMPVPARTGPGARSNVIRFRTRPASSSYDVVWWDPDVLELGVERPLGLRQEDLIGRDADAADVTADLRAYNAWRDEQRHALGRGATASLEARTVRQRVAEAELGEDPWAAAVTIEHVPVAGLTAAGSATDTARASRPAGPRFGALVHAALAAVPLDAGPARVESVTALEARILNAPPDEARGARDAVRAVLATPMLDRARAADALGRCRRETPVILRDVDGTLVEGVVDLAFEDERGWTVVDFKTDREIEGQLDRYRRQVAWYGRAIARATGRDVAMTLMIIW